MSSDSTAQGTAAGMQRRPDLLDAPITILPIFIDSAAHATQNGVSKMSTVLYHLDVDIDVDTSNRLPDDRETKRF